MFNLIMRYFDWADPNASMPVGRMLEYTDPAIANQFQQDRQPLIDRLAALPCLFMPEGRQDEICRVARLSAPASTTARCVSAIRWTRMCHH
jgi:hypothetical protein